MDAIEERSFELQNNSINDSQRYSYTSGRKTNGVNDTEIRLDTEVKLGSLRIQQEDSEESCDRSR